MKELNLSDEARHIHPFLQKYYSLHQLNELQGWDLVGIYIVLTLAIRKPRKWIQGCLNKPLTPFNGYQSRLLTDFPDALGILDPVFLEKRLRSTAANEHFPSLFMCDLTILDLFNCFQFVGVKNNSDYHINKSLLEWSLGKRPILLLHYIPTPREVLQQQANGERVVTLFLTITELSQYHTSKLTYMKGNREHARDPLEFLTHDLKHMEHFMDPMIHYEQKGFFRCISRVNGGKLKQFFLEVLHYPIDLYHEMEYVISDMNCFSTHLIRYVFAKLLIACREKLHAELDVSLPAAESFEEELQKRIRSEWMLFLHEMGMAEKDGSHEEVLLAIESFHCCMKLVDQSFQPGSSLTVEEWTVIRNYFEWIGRQS